MKDIKAGMANVFIQVHTTSPAVTPRDCSMSAVSPTMPVGFAMKTKLPEIRRVSNYFRTLLPSNAPPPPQHTSASLTINENADPDVRADMETFLNSITPEARAANSRPCGGCGRANFTSCGREAQAVSIYVLCAGGEGSLAAHGRGLR